VSDEPRLVTYPVPLRRDLSAWLHLPPDLTPVEAERICGMVRSLAMPAEDSRPMTDPTHSSGARRLRPLNELAAEHPFPWRTGTKPGVHGRTIYDGTQPTEENPRGGELIGVMDTGELTALIVGAVNDTARRAGLL
jgi:hypothetical protein